MTLAAAVALVVGLLVAGCGTTAGAGAGGASAGTTESSGGPAPAARPDPLLMIGVWRLRGTDEAPGTLLRLDATELSVWRSCGAVHGSWRADRAGSFVADAGQSGEGRCFGAGDTALTMRPGWLTASTRFRTDGASRLLLDEHGSVMARLDPATGTPPGDGARSAFTDPPVVDDRARQWFSTPAPLPSGLRPATRASLAGRWVPDGADAIQRPQVPFLRLDPDGSWTSSDGCNGSMGRWTAGGDGTVLATTGVSTLIGCHNVSVDAWWGRAARAGFDGPTLVLLDRDGARLGRLTR